MINMINFPNLMTWIGNRENLYWFFWYDQFSENPICILLGYHSKFEWSPKTILDPVSWTNYLFTFVTMLFGQLGYQIICCESDSKVNFKNLANSSWLTSEIEHCLSQKHQLKTIFCPVKEIAEHVSWLNRIRGM